MCTYGFLSFTLFQNTMRTAATVLQSHGRLCRRTRSNLRGVHEKDIAPSPIAARQHRRHATQLRAQRLQVRRHATRTAQRHTNHHGQNSRLPPRKHRTTMVPLFQNQTFPGIPLRGHETMDQSATVVRLPRTHRCHHFHQLTLDSHRGKNVPREQTHPYASHLEQHPAVWYATLCPSRHVHNSSPVLSLQSGPHGSLIAEIQPWLLPRLLMALSSSKQ